MLVLTLDINQDTKICALKQNELCFVYAGTLVQLRTHRSFIQQICTMSSQVILCLDEKILANPETLDLVHSIHRLYGVSAGLTRNPKTISQISAAQPENLVERFKQIRERVNQHLLLIPEVSIEGETLLLNGLGVDLMELAILGCPWIFLAVEGSPDPEKIIQLRECFNYLQMRGFPEIDIYFSLNNPNHRAWMLQTECYFSGPSYVHWDISNKCTHSCLFCGLYSPSFIEREKQKHGGLISDAVKKIMSAQIPFEKAVEVINSLPIMVQKIQFGGAGDPFTHPSALEILGLARNKGISVQILTNMEYFSENDLELLTQLGAENYEGIEIIANISAATAETYTRLRPKQTQKTFNKVINHAKQICTLRSKNKGVGVFVTFMSVMNRLNYREASQMVKLAWEIGANTLWFKPLEIYQPEHWDLVPRGNERLEYMHHLRQALKLADKLGISITQRDVIESFASFSTNLGEEKKDSLMNGGVPSDLYQKISCRIAYNYMRFQVNGEVRACCIAKYPIGEVRTQTWRKVWRSTAYAAFREKMKKIAIQQFHLTDPEFQFCQTCSHIPINLESEKLMA